MIWRDLEHSMNTYASKGSKGSRRRLVRRVWVFIDYCRMHRVKDPSQISRKLAFDWIDQTNHMQRYYAVNWLWLALGRPALPRPVSCRRLGGGEPA